jgi:hypothetical protein
MIESYDRETWRSFDRKSWRENMKTVWWKVMIEIHDRKKSHEEKLIYLHVLMSWIEYFKSILNFILLTQLNYLNRTFQLNLNTQIKNSDSNRVLMSWKLDSILMTQLNAISLKVSNYTFHSCFSLVSKASLSFEASFISSLNIH